MRESERVRDIHHYSEIFILRLSQVNNSFCIIKGLRLILNFSIAFSKQFIKSRLNRVEFNYIE